MLIYRSVTVSVDGAAADTIICVTRRVSNDGFNPGAPITSSKSVFDVAV
jgi:hypothetical protein